jgi:RES domain-containing protein
VARDIAAAVSRAGTATVAGRFQRHVSPRQEPLRGSRAGGRWGPEGAYPVLYLGRPTDSVIIEAYRHLVEPVEGMQPHMVGPRRLVMCEVEITSVLDLRESATRDVVGLTIADLRSEIGDYGACHHIGEAAHDLRLHGIIAPAAGGFGETLAVFEDRLPESEQPPLVEERTWDSLPTDPRAKRQ